MSAKAILALVLAVGIVGILYYLSPQLTAGSGKGTTTGQTVTLPNGQQVIISGTIVASQIPSLPPIPQVLPGGNSQVNVANSIYAGVSVSTTNVSGGSTGAPGTTGTQGVSTSKSGGIQKLPVTQPVTIVTSPPGYGPPSGPGTGPGTGPGSNISTGNVKIIGGGSYKAPSVGNQPIGIVTPAPPPSSGTVGIVGGKSSIV